MGGRVSIRPAFLCITCALATQHYYFELPNILFLVFLFCATPIGNPLISMRNKRILKPTPQVSVTDSRART